MKLTGLQTAPFDVNLYNFVLSWRLFPAICVCPQRVEIPALPPVSAVCFGLGQYAGHSASGASCNIVDRRTRLRYSPN